MVPPSAEPVRKASIFDKLAETADRNVQAPFRKLGAQVAKFPVRVMALALIGSLLCGSGVPVMFETEDRADKLWIPQGTDSKKDESRYEEYFPRAGSIAWFIAESRDHDLLTNDALGDVLDLHYQIYNLTVNGNPDYSLEDLCVDSGDTSEPCYMSNLLEAWDYEAGTLADDSDITRTLNAYYSSSSLESMCGGYSFSGNNITSAKAIKIMYYLKDDVEVINNEYVSERAFDWEDRFLDTVADFQSDNVKVYRFAARSFSDEFGRVIEGDIFMITLALWLMVVYMSINLGEPPCAPRPPVNTRITLAFSSVIAILLAIFGAYGLASYLGFFYSPVHSVLPFVVLGLGVDDSFVIANALDQVPTSLPMERRMIEALGHAATSVTVTSLTDFVAFAISTSSALPALASFCLYAALAILLLFVLQITFFASALVLDEWRRQSQGVDLCCCICYTRQPNQTLAIACCGAPGKLSPESSQAHLQLEESKEAAATSEKATALPTDHGSVEAPHSTNPPPGKISLFLRDKFAPMLLHPTVRRAVVVAFAALLCVCIWGASELSVEASTRSFIPDGSYLLRTLDKDDKYYGEQGSSMWIVTENIDYYAERDNLALLKDDVDSHKLSQYLRDPYTTDTYDSWYDSFTEYASTYGIPYETDEATFYSAIWTFLNGAGAYYNSSVAWENGVIVASRIETEFKAMATYTGGRLQTDAAKVVSAMEAVRDYDWAVDAYPWSYKFLNWETYKIIQQELITNLSLCLFAVLVISTLLIGHPGCSSLVCVCVAMTLIDILGFMYFWGLVIDSVTTIQTVIAIGLCVDYSAHVGHCFMLKSGTREERVIASLADVGSAVLNGACSTFLAVMLLAGSQSYVFRVLFQQFFLTVTLGLAHGMILLPVLLSWLGPQCYASVETRTSGDFELVEVVTEEHAGGALKPAKESDL